MTWHERVDALWSAFTGMTEADFMRQIEGLAAERPSGDAEAMFELASAHDSLGHEGKAVPLYKRALAGGLTGARRRRAVIQLGSSLRNLGLANEAVALLSEERDAGSDELDDAVSAFLALALIDAGKPKKGAALALTALSRHLCRYNRSLGSYAQNIDTE